MRLRSLMLAWLCLVLVGLSASEVAHGERLAPSPGANVSAFAGIDAPSLAQTVAARQAAQERVRSRSTFEGYLGARGREHKPNGPKAERSFAIVVVECVVYCPAAAAAATAGTIVASQWVVDQVDVAAQRWGSSSSIDITRADEASQSFDDFQKSGRAKRRTLRKKLEQDRRRVRVGEEAHHIVPVGYADSEYARSVMWRCGIDLNDPRNGVGLPRQYHRRMHTKEYKQAINRLMRRYDPDIFGNNCLSTPGNVFKNLGQALRDIGKYLEQGRFP